MSDWIDSRIQKPKTSHFDSYLVVFLYESHTFLGFGDWIPNGDYTDGEWQKIRCTNGNQLGGDVLFWMPHPKLPEVVGNRELRVKS